MARLVEISETEISALVEKSAIAKESAYAPYSNFKVGAALLTVDDLTITGCNVENCAYPLCTCAERCAIVKAVSEGHRKFKAIAVSTNADEFTYPCGGCRQLMSEFTQEQDYWVIVTKRNGDYKKHTVLDLLPHSFTPAHLSKGQSK